jgi:hypothetical protein
MIDAFRRLAGLHQITIPAGAVFLGIDLNNQYRDEVIQKGYEFLAANIISPEFVWPAADFISHGISLSTCLTGSAQRKL